MPAVSITENYGDVLSSTLKKWYLLGKIPDQIFKGLVLFKYLDKRVKKFSGGEKIIVPVQYVVNPTAKSYRHYDLLDMTPSEPFTSAFYNWKQLAVGLFISGLEMRSNSGPEQVFDLFKARYDNALHSLQKIINDQVWSDGTGNNSKDLLGLQAIVSSTPTTGTVGGIDRATNTWWQNYQLTSGAFETQGLKDLRTAWVNVSLNIPAGKPTVHVTTNTIYNAFENTIQPIERFTSDKGAKGGFQNGDPGFGSLSWKGAPVEWDNAAPSGNWYMLNDNFLQMCVHKDAYFKPSGREKPVDQDAYSEHIILQAELIGLAMRHLGVLTSMS